MKVILTQDVAKLGRRFETVEVPNGRGLNELIPKGIAMLASPENTKKIAAMKGKSAADTQANDEAFEAAIAALGDQKVSIVVEANEDGGMFQALKADAVVEALAAISVAVDAKQVHIGTPIKHTGDHEVMLINGATEAALSVEVVAK